MIRKAIAAAAILVSLTGLAHADPGTAENVLNQNDVVAKSYLDGVLLGFSMANSELSRRKEPLLFCVPPNLALTSEQNMHILRTYVAKHPDMAKYIVALPFLFAMQETFPCK